MGDGVSFPMRHQPLTSVSYGTTDDGAGATSARSEDADSGPGTEDALIGGVEQDEGWVTLVGCAT